MNTLGEKRVRVTFNPGNNDTVHRIKEKTAELINLLEDMKIQEINKDHEAKEIGEFIRLVSLAQTAYEHGAMDAVKAATYFNA